MELKKCKNCGNKMLFNPKTQKMYCEYCRSDREIIEETATEINKSSEHLDLYTCPSCGAKIVCEEHTTSTFCVYCKNTAILKDKLLSNLFICHLSKTKNPHQKAFSNPLWVTKQQNLPSVHPAYKSV